VHAPICHVAAHKSPAARARRAPRWGLASVRKLPGAWLCAALCVVLVVDAMSSITIGALESPWLTFLCTLVFIIIARRVFAVDNRSHKATPSEDEDEEVFPDPMPAGDMTRRELAKYDGSDETKPILIAAKGVVYDVTRGRDFYGKGGPYNCFTGIDCSRALGKVSLDKENLCADVKDFAASERDVLNDWVAKFNAKYPVVGKLTDGKYNGKF